MMALEGVHWIRLVLALCATVACGRTTATGALPIADAGSDEEGCIDAWLAVHRLDAFGNPEGTAYAGGTPLFDERAGMMQSRPDYVYRRHPDAAIACRGGAMSSMDR